MFCKRKRPEKPKFRETFSEWFGRQGIRNFSAREFTSYFEVKRRGAQNMEPPRSMWANILPTLRVVDDLRDSVGKPIALTSSYRCPAYNRAIGSGAASRSQHLQFRALDIKVKGMSAGRVYDKLLELRRAGSWVGGLGGYNTFTHIDTRGKNASW